MLVVGSQVLVKMVIEGCGLMRLCCCQVKVGVRVEEIQEGRTHCGALMVQEPVDKEVKSVQEQTRNAEEPVPEAVLEILPAYNDMG